MIILPIFFNLDVAAEELWTALPESLAIKSTVSLKKMCNIVTLKNKKTPSFSNH